MYSADAYALRRIASCKPAARHKGVNPLCEELWWSDKYNNNAYPLPSWRAPSRYAMPGQAPRYSRSNPGQPAAETRARLASLSCPAPMRQHTALIKKKNPVREYSKYTDLYSSEATHTLCGKQPQRGVRALHPWNKFPLCDGCALGVQDRL